MPTEPKTPKPPPWVIVKFRMPDDLVNAVIVAAEMRISQDNQHRNVSAMIRTILREELQRPPPPAETYAPNGQGEVFNIRMPNALLESLKDQVDKQELASLSTLIRAMLKRWLTQKNILQK